MLRLVEGRLVTERSAAGPEPPLALARGQFALVRWDAARAEGFLAVDQLGARSLFLAPSGRRLFFASELATLLRLLRRTPEPDDAAVVGWLARGMLERGRTLYAGVERLPGGALVRLRRDGWSREVYWTPAYTPRRRTRAEAIAEVRDALRHAVRARTAPDGATGVLLSGGVDSTSVAAIAAVEARAGASPLRSYSAVFPDDPSIDESELIALVNERLGLEGSQLEARPGSMLLPALEFLRTWRVPSLSPNLSFQLPLLRHAAADGADVLLDGQGGDELFGISPYVLADRLRAGRVIAAVRLARTFPGAGPRPGPRLVWRLLREYGLGGLGGATAGRRGPGNRPAPAWLASRVAPAPSEEWREPEPEGPLWWLQLADELTRGRERMGAHDFLRRRNGLAGVRGAHPLLDDLDLIELVLSLPPELAFDPVHDRPLLRAAVGGLLPEQVRLRRRKSYFNAYFRACLDGPDRPRLARLLRGDAEIGAHVRLDVVRRELLDAPPERRDGAWAWSLWRLAAIECWLQELREPDAAARRLQVA